MRKNETSKRCSTCEYFSHALEAMTDHVDYHSCIFYDMKIVYQSEAESCKMYKVRVKK